MAKKTPISYPKNATAEQKAAFRYLADVMKQQGISPYYYKQIFGKVPRGKRSKPATEERARLASIAKDAFQVAIETESRRLVIGGKPVQIASKIARAKDKKAEAAEIYKLLDALGVNYNDLDGKKMIFTDEEITEIRYYANLAFQQKRARGTKTDEDFFEWLSAVYYESGDKVREGRTADVTDPVATVLNELMQRYRERRAKQK